MSRVDGLPSNDFNDGYRAGWDAGKEYGQNLTEKELRQRVAAELSRHMRHLEIEAKRLRDENSDNRGYIIEKAVGYYSGLVGPILTGNWPS